MSFCEQLQKRRKELGLSRTELAARLGGTAASFVGKKTCALAKEHRQPLLLAAAAIEAYVTPVVMEALARLI